MSAAETLVFDPDQLTLGDMEDFEEKTGVAMDVALAERPVIDPATGKPVPDPDPAKRGRPLLATQMSAKQLRALVWLIKRKTEPTFTFEAARDIKVSEIQMGGPAEASGEDPGKGESDSE